MSAEKVLSLCKKAGFIYQEAGSGLMRYGPLGAELKRNIINEWWYSVVTSMKNVYPGESPIVNCDATGKLMTGINLISTNQEDNEKTTNTYLRSHLNQGPYVQTFRKTLKIDIPYGIAQVGKVFKAKEKLSIPNSCEPEVGVVDFFCALAEHDNWISQWQKLRLQWWKKFASHPENFSLHKAGRNDQDKHSAIEYQSPDGAYDVEPMTAEKGVEDEEDSNTASISLSAFIDRAVWAYICDSFTEIPRPYKKGKSTVLRLNTCFAPYKVVVVPREENDLNLNMYCRRLAQELRQAGIAATTWTNPYKEELILQDEIGTPFRIIGTEKTLETGTVMLQDRDTTLEEEMNGRDTLVNIQHMLFGARLK